MPRSSLPPGPPYPSLLQSIGFWTRPLAYLEQCRRRYGTPFTIRLVAAPPFVMVADPGAIKEIFTASPDVLHPGEGARVLEPVVGKNSVILLDGDAHMEQRKLMLPAFHGERMQALTDLVTEAAEREVASWPGGEVVDLHPRMQSLTLEVILRAVFGMDAGPELEALRARLSKMLEFGEKPMSLVVPPEGSPADRVLSATGIFREFERNQAEADELIFDLVDRRRREDHDGDDVLAMLLAARHEDGTPMSAQELRDELMTMLVAGHETTASSLAWAVERLCRHPEVVARLRAEVDAGEGDAYLTATIQETLRRRPVLPNCAPRLVTRPVEIGGRRYDPGACLVPNAYLVHHDPAIYDDPYAFRPERFLNRPPGTYTWIPFGGGRRRCLGASFAMLEMKVVLRALVRQRELAEAPGGWERPTRRNITITPQRGSRARLPARSGALQPA